MESIKPSYTGKIEEKDVPQVNQNLKDAFAAGITRPYEWRLQQLKALRKLFVDHRREIIDAVRKDLGKQMDMEALSSEYNLPLAEIDENIAHLKSWMKPEKVTSSIAVLPASSWIHPEPRGTVLIMSPWNYPVNLAIVPLAGAIAAGNSVFIKFSRHSQSTGETFAKLLPQYIDTRAIAVESEGGARFITKLIESQWDYIFFTGSVSVGTIIYQAAAKYLTPCTLELGGKNPCIVDEDANIDLTAKRIAWGKFFNAGQTCITADYILAHKNIRDKLVESLRKYLTQFYGDEPKNSKSFARVISKDHTKRLANLFNMGRVVIGGKSDVETNYIAPTVIVDPDLNSELMTDEIFGPVLPIVSVNSVEEAIQFINKRALPLALYYFSNNTKKQDEVMARTRSGAAVMNDLILHFTNSRLPFGGVGASGIGAYHGKLTFDTFVHKRAVVRQTTSALLDVPLRYPPYSDKVTWLVDVVTSGVISRTLKPIFKLSAVVVFLALLVQKFYWK
jgi:acyl-CoA reductase-like NAD-dependent aldehyde dehydrogenase